MNRLVWYTAAALIALGSLPFALLGLAQILDAAVHQFSGPAVLSDFLATYAGAFLWAHQPAGTYLVPSQRGVEEAVQAGRQAGAAFLLPPNALPVIAPLGLVSYPVAYLGWLVVGLGALVLAAWAAAPRIGPSWLVWVPLAALLWFPVSFDLVMGQSAVLMLLGLSLLSRERPWPAWARALALFPLTFKPPLVPVYLLAHLLTRRWRPLLLLLLIVLALGAVAVLHAGLSTLGDYQQLAQQKVQYTLDGPDEPNNYAPTLLRLFLSLWGPGPAALVATAVTDVAVWLCVAWAWARPDPAEEARLLRWTILPLASVVTASYAGMYEMSAWLLAVWLLLRYAVARPAAAVPCGTIALLLWATSNLAVVSNTTGNRLATLAGVLGVGVVTYLSAHVPAQCDAEPAAATSVLLVPPSGGSLNPSG